MNEKIKNGKEKKDPNSRIASVVETMDVFNSKLDFNNEEAFCNFIELNIKSVCKSVFYDDYVKHERQSYIHNLNKPLPSFSHLGKRFLENKPRIDFKIECRNGIYLVECKNLKVGVTHSLNNGVSQLLEYIMIAEQGGIKIKEAWLFSNKISLNLCSIITRFKLPLNVYILNKESSAVWRYNDHIKN